MILSTEDNLIVCTGNWSILDISGPGQIVYFCIISLYHKKKKGMF